MLETRPFHLACYRIGEKCDGETFVRNKTTVKSVHVFRKHTKVKQELVIKISRFQRLQSGALTAVNWWILYLKVKPSKAAQRHNTDAVYSDPWTRVATTNVTIRSGGQVAQQVVDTSLVYVPQRGVCVVCPFDNRNREKPCDVKRIRFFFVRMKSRIYDELLLLFFFFFEASCSAERWRRNASANSSKVHSTAACAHK